MAAELGRLELQLNRNFTQVMSEKRNVVYVEKNLTEGMLCSCQPGFYSPDAGARCTRVCESESESARARVCLHVWTRI